MRRAAGLLGMCLSVMACASLTKSVPLSVNPAPMAKLRVLDERFLSYNIEMGEVIGADAWAPYEIGRGALFEPRSPIDLSNSRLRKLAEALGPAYLRVSGRGANQVYFHTGEVALKKVPRGYEGILTRKQWQGVLDFALAVNAKLVTSFAVSSGVRDAKGVWTPREARKILAATQAGGGKIFAAEFFNEPNRPAAAGLPEAYDAASYGKDFAVFKKFLKAQAPDIALVGPATGGEETLPFQGPAAVLHVEDLLKATSPGVDIFSYHFYGALSQRCVSRQNDPLGTGVEAALTEQWFSRAERAAAFYRELRDRYEPGKPLWVTEMADAACGGNPWASTFRDSFRYVIQLSRLALRGVQAHFHSALAASDYGLLDSHTFLPRPNYWVSLLWRRWMGPVVLDAGEVRGGVPLYAHCLRDIPGGVALLVVNTSETQPLRLRVPMAVDRYTLTALKLEDTVVRLNGEELKLGLNDQLPSLEGERIARGPIELPPASITFLVVPDAKNGSCP